MKKSSSALVFTSGFAMFSMFFGSGNLVFPIEIGMFAQSSFVYAILGFIVTGVCLPFLGLVGIMQYKGDRLGYFATLGKVPAFILTAIMLALIGPAGIMPRCAIVSYGGVESLFPGFPLWIFSAIFCLMITALVWNKSKIVDIIGVYLTPLKLGSFILLIIIGLVVATRTLDIGPDISTTFTLGLTRGYQTMDLVASFFFGSTIYEYIRSHLADANDSTNDPALDKKILSLGFKASLVGGALLSLCYVGFVLLGAKYSHLLAGVPKEALLMEISKDTIGQYAVPFVATTLLVTCLATSTIVAALFSDFLYADVLRHKISRKMAIIITMVIAYAISLLGFEGICAMLGAILEWVYPFLMVFALYMMIRYKLSSK